MRYFCVFLMALPTFASLGCSGVGKSANKAPDCAEACRDQVALRALREAMKLIYNLELQGKKVGPQDATTPCPQGGSARVFGQATSNELQGATEVELVYEFQDCSYLSIDEEPDENYHLTATGAIWQTGTLAVQPTATTALLFEGEQISLEGTVYDPALDYRAEACELQASQSGNELSGTWCGRVVGVDL